MAEDRLITLDRAGLKALYHSQITPTFPPAERRPLRAMLRLLDQGVYRPLALVRGEDVLAYALLWRDRENGYALLDYLGVCPSCRGQGVGSALLRAVLETCRVCLLAEVEAPGPSLPPEENALRTRRLDFYRRAGFSVLPYEADIFRVRYVMLTSGDPQDAAGAMEAHIRLYRTQFAPPVYRRMVHIPLASKE